MERQLQLQTQLVYYGISDVLEAQLRSNRTQTTQSDSPMTKVDRSTYAGFSNKLSKGTPNQYWVERFIDKVTIHIYPTPDSTNASKDMHFFLHKKNTRCWRLYKCNRCAI